MDWEISLGFFPSFIPISQTFYFADIDLDILKSLKEWTFFSYMYTNAMVEWATEVYV